MEPRTGNPGRDDKVGGQRTPQLPLRGMDRAAVIHALINFEWRKRAAGPSATLRFARDDKLDDSAHLSSRYEGWAEPRSIPEFSRSFPLPLSAEGVAQPKQRHPGSAEGGQRRFANDDCPIKEVLPFGVERDIVAELVGCIYV
jgi:hypothetical protein